MKDSYESPHPQRRASAAGVDLAYVDTGPRDGRPLVFVHGNPTSSYLWRNIISALGNRYRCLAPDLPGMGNSGAMPDAGYRFVDHFHVFEAWMRLLDLGEPVTLICHDWGSALSFLWAQRNPHSVAAIAYMEAIVLPRVWSDFPEGRDRIFKSLRGPEGEKLVLEDNFFVEVVLPKSILRRLSEAEMAAYRAPFPTPESRRPTLVWPRELPIEGEPADVVEIVESYGAWLSQSSIPKLFINAEPGATLIGRSREFCRRWPNQRELTVEGLHFIQEDAPEPIGHALGEFLSGLPNRPA